MTLKKLLILIILTGLWMGCQDHNSVPKPKNLIPENQMVQIMVDLAKINAAHNISSKNFKKRDDPKKLLFDKYHIDSLQLIESTNYYSDNYKLNKRLYAKVQTILQRESDSLNAIEKKKREEEKKKEGKTDKKDSKTLKLKE